MMLTLQARNFFSIMSSFFLSASISILQILQVSLEIENVQLSCL